MRVHHLNCGTMCPPFAALLEASRMASLAEPRTLARVFARGHMVCHCLAIELDSGLMLVDTGLGTADVADPRGRLGLPFVALTAPACALEETALAQLAGLGFAPRDVRHIFPTHLDLDHAGGIADFPKATVHLLSREHDAAMARATLGEKRRYRPVHWAHHPHFQLHEPTGEHWFGFEGVRPLPGSHDEVLIIPLFGHTRGHAGIAVRTENGWLLHAGDAYFHHDEVHGTPPSCPPGLAAFQHVMQVNGSHRLKNRDRLRELVRSHQREVTVFCAHDANELHAFDHLPVPPQHAHNVAPW